MKKLFPLFIVRDVKVEAKYFIKKFQFETVFESDWYIHLLNGQQELALLIEKAENQPEFLHQAFSGQGAVLSIEVESAQTTRQDFSDKEVIYELKTEEWGQTHFMVRSPAGIVIDVLDHTAPEEYA